MEESRKSSLTAIASPKFPRKYLASDETVVFEAYQCWGSCMKAATLYVVVAAVASVALLWNLIPDVPELPYLSTTITGTLEGVLQGAGILVAFVALVASLWVYNVRNVGRKKKLYVVTDERVILQEGLLFKQRTDIPLHMIEQVRAKPQTLRQRILGYGTIKFTTQGFGGNGGDKSKEDMEWENVPDPMRVRTIIQEVADIRQKPKIYSKKELADRGPREA